MSPARCIAALALLALAGPAVAHDQSPPPLRELLRIQGYRAPAPTGVSVARQVTLVVLGQPIEFAANEWRSFAFHEPLPEATPKESKPFTLQGDRPLLRRLSTARPDQQITILAERRAGMADLFVLAVDRCPPE
ncbi:MAG: hypothetical protein ACRERC_10050 [Candidatus Binatia bacterium]